jgi:CPA2 family monovalent cation:H+ antiporter-2
MHDTPLLINIAVALGVAFLGGTLARRIGLPTIVGYLLAGVAIGPFSPAFVGDVETISQLAELGVIFLMFGVGIHFSLRDLWRVRSVAVPGAIVQMLCASALGFGLTRLWGWSVASGLVLGVAISVASTVVLLRGLMDNGLLNTKHGRVAVGWLVLEDLASVLILVTLPVFAAVGPNAEAQKVVWTLVKAGAFVALTLFVGGRVVPWVLLRVAHTRSRELFILVILVLSLGTAIGSAELFGVSLALGAFLAGVIISESPLSHQVGADLLPFREAFAVLFFVSVGMLVNPAYLVANAGQVLALTGLIVVGKSAITILLGTILPAPARTALVVAAGLSQIGEFSFIIGQAGLTLGLLDRDQYSLILAGSLLSITLNPFMYRLIRPLESALRRFPGFWRRLDKHGPELPLPRETLSDHVVIVGYGRVGRHIVEVLGSLNVPHLVVDSDATRIEQLEKRNVPTLFGDAANSEVLTHAQLPRARALVVTLPDEATTEMTVMTARRLAPDLPIIARAITPSGVKQLAELGAQDVIHPELEGGLEIVRHTLLRLGFPIREVQKYADAVRREHYDVSTHAEQHALRQFMEAAQILEITLFELAKDSPVAGLTLAEADIRGRTGASVVVILRGQQVLPNPKSHTVLQPGDSIGLIGDEGQIAEAERLITQAAYAEVNPVS